MTLLTDDDNDKDTEHIYIYEYIVDEEGCVMINIYYTTT